MIRKIWERWKKFAEIFGSFMSRVILTVLYFVLVLPYGIVIRLFSDPLKIKKRPDGSAWKQMDKKEGMALNDLKQQY